METLNQQIKKAITNKAFDRCLGCVDTATKEIKQAFIQTVGRIRPQVKKLEKKGWSAEAGGYESALNDILAEINK